MSTSTRWSTGRSERRNFKFPGGVVVRRFGERKVTSNRRAEISAANRVERRARPPGSRDIDTYHAGVLEGREFGAEFREDARVDRGWTGAEVVLPFGGSLHLVGVVNPVQTMVSGVGKREGEVARGRGPMSVLLEALELIESVAVDLPRPPGVGGVHVFCATMRGLRAKTNGSHQKSKPTAWPRRFRFFW